MGVTPTRAGGRASNKIPLIAKVFAVPKSHRPAKDYSTTPIKVFESFPASLSPPAIFSPTPITQESPPGHTPERHPGTTRQDLTMFSRIRSSSESPTTTSLSSSKRDDGGKKALPPLTTSTNGSTSSTRHQHQHKDQGQNLDTLLSCPVCLEDYQVDASREPMFLQCYHSVCRSCLPNLTKQTRSRECVSEVSCPECRGVTQVPHGGLTQNFYLANLIETRRKKAREQDNRLRMWCRECDRVALESCSGHQVVHLATVLTNTLDAYCNNKRHLSTVLQTRAERRGTEAQEVQAAVDQLDKATLSLRRRLVARLDNATLTQATASSLLQEVEKMNRRLQEDAKLKEPLARRTSQDARDVDGEGIHEGGSEAMEDNNGDGGRDILDHNTTPPTSPARQAPPVPPRTHDTTTSGPGRDVRFDHMTCHEQESRILQLKECLTTLDKMTLKQEDPKQGDKASKGGKSPADNLSKEELKQMFQAAIDALAGDK